MGEFPPLQVFSHSSMLRLIVALIMNTATIDMPC